MQRTWLQVLEDFIISFSVFVKLMSVAYLSVRLRVASTRVSMVLMQFAGFLHMGAGLV